jgi:hypothetical protein
MPVRLVVLLKESPEHEGDDYGTVPGLTLSLSRAPSRRGYVVGGQRSSTSFRLVGERTYG